LRFLLGGFMTTSAKPGSETSGLKKSRPRRKRRRGWLWLIPILLILGGAGWYFFLRPSESASTEVTGPTTVTVTPEIYRETVSGTGTLSPARSVAATFEFDTSGTLAGVVAVGTRVNAGDVLAEMDTSSFQSTVRDAEVALEKAQAQRASTASTQTDNAVSLQESIQNAELSVQDAQRQVATAQSNLELAQRLQAVGSESSENVQVAQNTYDAASATLAKDQLSLQTLQSSRGLRSDSSEQDLRNADLSITAAQLSLERAEADLAATQLLAPFAGVVSEVNVEEGSIVSSTTPVLTLVDDSQVKLVAQVDETEISQVQLDMTAEVTLDAVPDETFTGRVTTIAPVARVENNIPIFDVTITIDNTQGKLRPGMSAQAEILIREIENTATIPSSAVQAVGDNSSVLVQQPDGSFAPQSVTVVTTSGLNSIVQSDLSEGSVILVADATPTATAPEGTNETTNGRNGGLPFLGGPPAGGLQR
jgi:HlyD family secretion protein